MLWSVTWLCCLSEAVINWLCGGVFSYAGMMISVKKEFLLVMLHSLLEGLWYLVEIFWEHHSAGKCYYIPTKGMYKNCTSFFSIIHLFQLDLNRIVWHSSFSSSGLFAILETLLLLPVMSQAVLLSEAYRETITSCFILISAITLWRELLLSSPVCSPHSSLLFFPSWATTDHRRCILVFCLQKKQVRKDEVRQMLLRKCQSYWLSH